MANLFSFPTFSQMYSGERRFLKRLREFLRYQLRKNLHKKQCNDIVDFLNTHPIWQALFRENAYRLNSLLNVFCDKRFSAQQRLEAIQQNLLLAEQYFGVDFCQKLLTQKSMLISQLTEDLGLYLNINDIDPLEGFFSLNIKNPQKQERIYDASFSFLAPNKLLIASIQGPNHNNAQDTVRSVTKQLHGTRPMFMLVVGFKTLAQQFGSQLVGIPHKAQAKYRFSDSARLLFNYNSFWQENNAELRDQYWEISSIIEQKPLEEIASKKRAMYRKRYEMFDKLQQDIKACFAR
ncbi:DUF535 domain-containing protein [[Haemophilus] felis]|uniref:DUF535 domain-containing protein n=1 Tax=[Haemophilus] felis TaxID=123822 RepID=A0A1T0BA98_9PAST|nr:DUF535 domain-containing protein [[Haemophilus] felis]NBI40323.1 DUF535 domain-containing protein [[Haemophilus] felis]NBI42928.1 DUF535 domain-containing protein [[Haemophilus] felis]OOS07057.1 hypothetical protein B0188_01300 [[Haemophilus] felis]